MGKTVHNQSTHKDCLVINGRDIVPVRYSDSDTLQAVKMAHDAHIVANATMPNNPLLQPGLRLGDWSQVKL